MKVAVLTYLYFPLNCQWVKVYPISRPTHKRKSVIFLNLTLSQQQYAIRIRIAFSNKICSYWFSPILLPPSPCTPLSASMFHVPSPNLLNISFFPLLSSFHGLNSHPTSLIFIHVNTISYVPHDKKTCCLWKDIILNHTFKVFSLAFSCLFVCLFSSFNFNQSYGKFQKILRGSVVATLCMLLKLFFQRSFL